MEKTKIAMHLEEESKPIKKMCEKLMDAVNYELEKGVENIDTKELGEAIDMIKDLYEAKKEMYEACYYKQIMEAMEESEYGEDYDEYGPMDDGRRGYRGQPRSQSGRFMIRGDGRRSNRGRRGYEEPMYYGMESDMYPMEYYRDMDMMGGRMYYTSGNSSTGGGSNSGSQSSSGMSSGSGQSSSGNMGGSNRGYSESGRNNQRDGREGRSGSARRGYMEAKEMNKGNSAQEKQEKMKELENYTKELSEDVTEMINDATPEEKTMLKQKLQTLIQKI